MKTNFFFFIIIYFIKASCQQVCHGNVQILSSFINKYLYFYMKLLYRIYTFNFYSDYLNNCPVVLEMSPVSSTASLADLRHKKWSYIRHVCQGHIFWMCRNPHWVTHDKQVRSDILMYLSLGQSLTKKSFFARAKNYCKHIFNLIEHFKKNINDKAGAWELI